MNQEHNGNGRFRFIDMFCVFPLIKYLWWSTSEIGCAEKKEKKKPVPGFSIYAKPNGIEVLIEGMERAKKSAFLRIIFY